MKDLGHGEYYLYAHDYEDNFVTQEFLPNEFTNTKFYEPGANAREHKFKERLQKLWKDKYRY